MTICGKKITGWSFALFLLASLALVGCQSIESRYLGYKAENASIVQFTSDETRQGSWKTFDMDLNYRYDYADNLLNISGTVDLSPHYDMNFGFIGTLDIYLFFLDNESRVLATAVLAKALPQPPDQQLKFARELTIPANSRAIAFGYYGEANNERGGMQGRGGLGFFYDLPKKPK